MTALTQKVIEYGKNGKDKEKLMDGIVKEILENRERYGLSNKDAAQDLIGAFYPRLPALLGRFAHPARDFEPYLASNLRFFRKNEYFRNKTDSVKLRAYRDWVNMELVVKEEPEAYEGEGSEVESPEELFARTCAHGGRSASSESAGKRILFLCLKCAFCLSDRQMEDYGRRMGLGEGHLMARVESLRSLASARIKRLERFRSLRDGVYAKLILARRRLHEELEVDRKKILEERVRELRGRLERCLRRIRRSQSYPSNGEIALVLGLPKGTVDSGLHYFKRLHLGSAARQGLSSGHENTLRERQPAQKG